MCTVLDHLKQQLKDIDDQLLELNITVRTLQGTFTLTESPLVLWLFLTSSFCCGIGRQLCKES